MLEGLTSPLFLVIVEGVGGSQLRCDAQRQFKSGEETFQGDRLLQLILQVCQLQQLLLSSPVQLLVEFLFGFPDLLLYLTAFRLLAKPLV